MPRALPTTDAQRARDDGLARVRRITWWSGVGAAVLTAVASLIAATTIPGHSQATQPDATGTAPAQQPSAVAPAPTAQPGAAPPVIVSGGS